MMKSGPFLIATLLAKNEEDILEHTLKYHIEEEGIDFIIATDNGSKDKTKKILQKYKEVKIIIDEFGDNHNQSAWVTRMARIASTYDPKWIVHLDADEFWCNLFNLYKYDKKTLLIKVNKFYNHLINSQQFDFETTKFYTTQHNLKYIGIAETPAKVIHRNISDVCIENGNHNIIHNNNIVPTYSEEICVHHYPIRSYSQFERKVRDGAVSLLKLNLVGVGQHWIDWYELYKNKLLHYEFNNIIKNSELFVHKNDCPCWFPTHLIKN